MKVKSLSRVSLFVTPWTVAYQVPPSMGFPRQEYWSGLPFPSPGDLPDPGIEPRSPALEADALTSEPPGKPEAAAKGKCLWPHILLKGFPVCPPDFTGPSSLWGLHFRCLFVFQLFLGLKMSGFHFGTLYCSLFPLKNDCLKIFLYHPFTSFTLWCWP